MPSKERAGGKELEIMKSISTQRSSSLSEAFYLLSTNHFIMELSPDNNHFENNVQFISLDGRANVIANFCDQVSRNMDATGLQLPAAWTCPGKRKESIREALTSPFTDTKGKQELDQ
ncbi:hypothetical protein KY290_032682 [Solanum tuberosum]|uniref:Uncharacterized protein n=1 Tax=Solanum tuberosum TaxID=4113 RepID=A0ABQ7UDD0_SOLTU|nr:hypothetical protein KY290_032682 [Solanum tuberosum]